VRTILLLLAYLAASVLSGLLAGVAAIFLLPCEWFGSTFEGGCGFAALWVSVAIGVAMAAVVFGGLLFRVLGKRQAGPQPNAGIVRKLLLAWLAALVAMLGAAFFLPFAGLGGMVNAPVYMLASAGFIAASFVLLRTLGVPPVLAFLPLLPGVGTLVLVALVARAYLAPRPTS
jgi:hypothetical protein